MRAGLLRSPFFTEPPPTSETVFKGHEKDVQREPARIAMYAGKEHLLAVGPLRACVSAFLEGRDKLDKALIESQRMAEVRDGIIRTAEWQI